MNSSLLTKYLELGDFVNILLKNNQILEGRIIDFAVHEMAIENNDRLSIVSFEQITVINRTQNVQQQSKNENTQEDSKNEVQYTGQSWEQPEPARMSQLDVEVANLAVQLHTLYDLYYLEEFYEENKDIIDADRDLSELYNEKLKEFS